MGKIDRNNGDQDLILVSTVKNADQGKFGRKVGMFMGEYIVVDDVTRIYCKQKYVRLSWVNFTCGS